MKVIKDISGYKYKLSTKRISEESGRRYVLLADLKKNLPGYGECIPKNYDTEDENHPFQYYPEILYTYSDREYYVVATWITVDLGGCLSIGCKSFGVTASRAIYKAMGVRRKVQ